MVKVSVLIPTYNYARFIEGAIQSTLMQTFQDFELVIVDNNSTDNTESVVEKYLLHTRVRYFKNSSNIGLTPNFNKCLGYARGKYIKFLLADDLLHHEALEKMVSVLDEYPNVSLVASGREEFGLRTSVSEPHFTYFQKGKKIIYESLSSRNFLGEPTIVMFRRSDIQKVGNFNPAFHLLTDWDMWLRLLTVGDCYILPEVLAYFRVHQNQQSALISKELNNYFENYFFYKNVQTCNPYNIQFKEFNINYFVEMKAADCFKVILKSVPRLHKRKSWSLIRKAFKIVWKENISIYMLQKALTHKYPSGFESFEEIREKNNRNLSGIDVYAKNIFD